MNSLKQQLIHAKSSITNAWPIWYGIRNRDARKLYEKHTPILSKTQRQIASQLLEDGIAFTTIDDLFPGEKLLPVLTKYMENLGQMEGAIVRKKGFLHPYWDERSEFDLSNPFFKISLRSEVLDIVNSYDRMFRRFNYLHLTETVPVGESAAVQSQRWHRDPGEKRMVKMFIYLNDVDSNAGPFTYVRKSQFGSGVYGNTFPQYLPSGIYPPEGAVEKVVNKHDIVEATGKAGSIIFCDTAGLHRGGHAKSKSRFMFTAFYPSTHWTEKTLFTIAPSVKEAPLSPAARYALFLD